MFTLFLNSLLLLAFNVDSAFAQGLEALPVPPGVGGPAENPVTTSGMLLRMAVMFLMVFLIFKTLVINPQKRKLAEQSKLAAELRKGDQVVTTGGILGRVISIEKESITLEIASGVRVKFETSSIVKRVEVQQQKEAA